MNSGEHDIDIQPQKEKNKVPRVRELARANLLAQYWEKPIASLFRQGEVMPGIQMRFLPEDTSMTLGNFLTDGDEHLSTFGDFKTALTADSKASARAAVKAFTTICPSPEELFQKNPEALNWVPWETFIAYGDVLQNQKGQDAKEQVAAVIAGEPYVTHVEEKFPEGFPRKRTDIVLERQNKDPRTQGIMEAVSNSIDAISEREKIGQFGLGVKQIFTWLETGKGEVQVISKTAEGKQLSLKAKKGFDDQIYIKFSPLTESDQAYFAENESGSVIKITDIELDSAKQQDISQKLHDRFRYVPETTISVNDTHINGHDQIKVIGRETPVLPNGEIAVTMTDTDIVIKDSGSGMDEKTLFTMFLPGYGKGYHPLSVEDAKELAATQAEVLLIDAEQPKIVFSRNRETDFQISVPDERLNVGSKTICIELGRILKVSEGRDGFEIDANFAAALPILVEKTLADGALSHAEKTAFLNSLSLGIDQLSGYTGNETGDKLAAIVKKTKKGIREAALPYLHELQESTLLLPNYKQYSKVAVEAQYLDPYLLHGIKDIPSILEKEGFDRLQGEDGIMVKGGWKIFTGTLTESQTAQALYRDISSKEGLITMRQQITEMLPVVVDAQEQIVIVDKEMWETMQRETNPIKKAYMQETIQIMLNEKVKTSYEEFDPTSIFVTDPIPATEKSHDTEIKILQDEDYKINKNFFDYEFAIAEGKMYHMSSGKINCYNLETQELEQSNTIEGITRPFVAAITPTEGGFWIMPELDTLVKINPQGKLLEQYSIPFDITMGSHSNNIVISPKGEVCMKIDSSYHYFDPISKMQVEFAVGGGQANSRPYITDTGEMYSCTNGVISHRSLETSRYARSSEDGLVVDNRKFNTEVNFFSLNGKEYVMGMYDSGTSQCSVGIFELSENNQEISTKLVKEFGTDIKNLSFVKTYPRPDSNAVGIQISSNIFNFTIEDDKFTLADTMQFTSENMQSESAYTLAALKELFGDPWSTSYEDATPLLSQRLQADFRRDTTNPFKKVPEKNVYIEKKPKQPFTFSKSHNEIGEHRRHVLNEKISDHSEIFLENEFINQKKIPKRRTETFRNILETKIFENDKFKNFPVSDFVDKPPEIGPMFTIFKSSLENQKVQELLDVISTEQCTTAFHTFWDELAQNVPVTKREELKMKFVTNAPFLRELQGKEITPDVMQLFFYADNPKVFLAEPLSQAKALEQCASLETVQQRELYIQTLEKICKGKNSAELEIIYGQMDRLLRNEAVKERFFATMNDYATDMQQAIDHPEAISITNPMRAYILFITNQADFLRSKEMQQSSDGFASILPENVPLEMLAYFRLSDGLMDVQAISERIAAEGGVEAMREKVHFDHYEDEIRKAIHAQSVEPGVAKRELLQNALYAIRKKDAAQGTIAVDFYLRNNGQEFVEEIKDTGTGIENVLSFLVPGVTTKGDKEGLGIFGTGFYKTLEDVDHIEVDTISRKGEKGVAQRVRIDLIKDAHGIVQKGVIREMKEKEVSALTETGTTIRMVRENTDTLPELDAMLAKHTYLTMGGLATNPQVAANNVELQFVNEEGRNEAAEVTISSVSKYDLEGIGQITFIEAPSLPAAMTSGGLRMSPLLQSTSDYMLDVPESLKTFLAEQKISVSLSKEFPLVKDRSRIADEEAYLSVIQRTIATETLKRTAHTLLSDGASKIRGILPEDILTNSNYYTLLTSEEGKQAYAIAEKINAGNILDTADITYINDTSRDFPLVTVLLGIERDAGGDQKDSLLRRFQYIQEKSGNTHISYGLAANLGVKKEETGITPQLAHQEIRLVASAKDITQAHGLVAGLELELSTKKRVPEVVALADTTMDGTEKELLMSYFNTIGFSEVLFAPAAKLGSSGVFTGTRLILNADILYSNPRERWEIINHEVAHVFEKRAQGLTEGSLDLHTERDNDYTHQQEGSFGNYYKIAARVMQHQTTS